MVASYRSLQDRDLTFEELLRELEAPSARFLEAAALFLVELARRGDVSLPAEKGEIKALRRLGFIADHLAKHPALTQDVQRRLKSLADSIYKQVRPLASPDLGFSRSTSKGRIRRLQRDVDEIDRRWKVWGKVELRQDFLR